MITKQNKSVVMEIDWMILTPENLEKIYFIPTIFNERNCFIRSNLIVWFEDGTITGPNVDDSTLETLSREIREMLSSKV